MCNHRYTNNFIRFGGIIFIRNIIRRLWKSRILVHNWSYNTILSLFIMKILLFKFFNIILIISFSVSIIKITGNNLIFILCFFTNSYFRCGSFVSNQTHFTICWSLIIRPSGSDFSSIFFLFRIGIIIGSGSSISNFYIIFVSSSIYFNKCFFFFLFQEFLLNSIWIINIILLFTYRFCINNCYFIYCNNLFCIFSICRFSSKQWSNITGSSSSRRFLDGFIFVLVTSRNVNSVFYRCIIRFIFCFPIFS